MKNITKNIRYIGFALVALTPAISFAALDGIKELLCSFGRILNLVIPIVFGLALIFFFWGLGQFILHSGEEKAREEGRSRMIWGIVALFIMISIYGILNWFGNLIDIRPSGMPNTSTCSGSNINDTINL